MEVIRELQCQNNIVWHTTSKKQDMNGSFSSHAFKSDEE